MYEPNLLVFLAQGLIFTLPFIVAYLAYREMRYPERRDRIRKSLQQLGIRRPEELEKLMEQDYQFRHYALPLIGTCALCFVIYSFSHPAVIRTGLWIGVVEDVINIFNLPGESVDRALYAGRFLFWGWLGAYIYSFTLVFRRFMYYDLTPMVFIYVASRFALAWVLGGIVGMAFGALSRGAITPADLNLATICVVVFFIGFFPDQGLDWITAFSKRTLGQAGGIAKEQRLSELEGMNIFQQSRLEQEGIENVQNLATAYIAHLVIATPFNLGQIVDWVDQAILLMYANEMYKTLEETGIRCASDFLAAAANEERFAQLVEATGISAARLRLLVLSVESAVNIRQISRFRWYYSMNPERIDAINHYSEMILANQNSAASRITSEMLPVRRLNTPAPARSTATPPYLPLTAPAVESAQAPTDVTETPAASGENAV
jgi:hypothetical protein